MPLYIGLNVVTLVMCIVTLTMAVAALMPQIKQGLQLLRDGLLWALLLGIIAFVGFIGWGRLFELRHQTTQATEDPLAEIFDFRPTSEPELDPLPLPTARDQAAATNEQEARLPERITTIPVVQVSKNRAKVRVTSTSGFRANRSQNSLRRRVSSTAGLNR